LQKRNQQTSKRNQQIGKKKSKPWKELTLISGRDVAEKKLTNQ
jgi:hypothetical protein